MMQATHFYRRPFIPLTAALVVGIAVGAEVPGGEPWALAMTLACGLGTARCLIRRRPAAVLPLLLFAALGYLSLQAWIDPRFPENHVSRFADSGPWRILGVVDARPLEFESRSQFVLRVERLASAAEARAATGLLRVTVTGASIALQHGDRVALYGRIRPIRSFNNPGGFDYRRHMAYREIWASAAVGGADLERLEPQTEPGIGGAIDRMRSAVAGRIDQADLGPAAGVLKALVMGDPSGVPPDVRLAFMRTGTSHILAISGLHLTIVASIAFALFRWLLSWVPLAIQHAWTRKGAAVLTLLPITFYALIAGFSPSTQRALIMVAVFLLSLLVGRETDLMNSLALAALSILCVQPASLFSISFQLSFAAVLSIVYAFERAAAARPAPLPAVEGRAAKIRRGLKAFFGVSLIATWGTLPLGMYYFNSVPLVGLLANCIAVPLMGYLVVVVGLAGALLATLSVPAALICYQISGFVLSVAIAAMEWMAAWPYAAIRTVSPSPVELILFYLLSWAAFDLAAGRKATAAPGGHAAFGAGSGLRRFRSQTMPWAVPGRNAAVAVLAFSLVAAVADAGYWVYQRFGRQDLRVTVLDVGQGSAVLLELPGGGTALVDGGGFADPAAFDVGARVVAPFLWRRKIASIDTLILTHPNADHMNGLVFIADHFQVRALWTSGESRPGAGYEALMQAAARRGIAVPDFSELPRESVVQGARIEVLYPPVDFLERSRTERWRRDENNNSLVTRVSLGQTSVLIPGDIMRPAEKELVALAGERLRSTVLIAPHHGSRSSSSEEFLRAAAPAAVLISCAGRPGSGMPHPRVLERYDRQGARLYRTDRDGAIRVTSDGRDVAIIPYVSTN